jgi:hypothetical protein
MAKNIKSVAMLKAFTSMPDITKNMWLTSWFKTTPEDITEAEFISIDIERSDEDIAPVLTDISTGAVIISEDVYTNKEIKPPAFALKMPFNVYDLTNVGVGETEYEAAQINYQAKMRMKILKSWAKLTNMIKRTIELQASQILQTGTLTLYNSAGVATYLLDFAPKATHFPTAGTAWGAVGSNPLGDISDLAEVIRNDGLVDPKNLIMGLGAFSQFVANDDVKTLFYKDQYAIGSLSPQMLNNGATLQGFINIGNYRYAIWTYGGRFIDPVTSTKTQYVNWDSCIMLPDPEDLDFRKCFGAVPQIVDSVPEFRDVLPSRVTVPGAFDFKPRIYTDEAAETVYSEIKSRPILIPVSIDRFGCIDTNATT